MKTATVSIPENYDEFLQLVQNRQFNQKSQRLTYSYDLKKWMVRLFNEDFLLFRHNFFEDDLEELFKLSNSIHNPTQNDAYHYIPLSATHFLEVIRDAIGHVKEKQVRFVDAGCGIGDKTLLASEFFDIPADGIEYSDMLYEWSLTKYHRTYYRQDIHFLKGDITTFDFSPYNLIYAYNPIITARGMTSFFENVIRTARVGTICVFVNVDSGAYAIDKLKSYFSCYPNKHGNRHHRYGKIFRLKKK